MRVGERIPLHAHSDLNDGGRLMGQSLRGLIDPQVTAAPAVDNTTPTSSAPGDVADPGSNGGASHSDHRHGRESGATPSGGYGTAAAGSASTVLLSDAVLAKPTAADVDFSADVTTNNATTSAHGLAPKLDGNSGHFLAGDGSWGTPSGGGGGYSDKGGIVDTIKQTSSASASYALILDHAPSSGAVLLLACGIVDATNTITPTQTGVTWTLIAEKTSSATRTRIYRGVAGAGASATVTMTRGGGSATTWAAVAIFSGILGTVHQAQSQSSGGSYIKATQALFPTQNVVALFAATTNTGSGAAVSPSMRPFRGGDNFCFAGYVLGCIVGMPIVPIAHWDATSNWSAVAVAFI